LNLSFNISFGKCNFALMRNVILYIDNTEVLDFVVERIQSEKLDVTHFTVVLQLSELSKEVIPLIGDLAELRVHKYLRLLNEWYADQPVKFKFFKPVVFQSNFKAEDFERLLEKESSTEIYLYGKPNMKFSRIIDKLSKTNAIKIIEVNSQDDLKACE